MKLRVTSGLWLCLIAGGAGFAAQAETPYAYGPSGAAFKPADLERAKVPAKVAAQPQTVKAESVAAALPAGPQPYTPALPSEPAKAQVIAAPVAKPATPAYVPIAVAAPVKPAIKAEARAMPVKASAQMATPLPAVGPTVAALPACNYAQIRKTGFDAYVGRMWATRTPEAQKALIGCIDQVWNYHLSAANTDPNSHFEEVASPAMLAAMQYDVDGFVKEMEGRQKLRLMWLATLSSDSFSWNRGAPCEHDGQRRSLQVLLDDGKSQLQNLVAYRDIQDAFSAIQPCRVSAAN